jgi:hypothetical protein
MQGSSASIVRHDSSNIAAISTDAELASAQTSTHVGDRTPDAVEDNVHISPCAALKNYTKA